MLSSEASLLRLRCRERVWAAKSRSCAIESALLLGLLSAAEWVSKASLRLLRGEGVVASKGRSGVVESALRLLLAAEAALLRRGL